MTASDIIRKILIPSLCKYFAMTPRELNDAIGNLLDKPK